MAYLNEVEQLLDMPAAEKRQVLRELASHRAEIREELAAAGRTWADADAEAARRLGRPAEVARRLNAVHCRATWRATLLAVAPILGSYLLWWAAIDGFLKPGAVLGPLAAFALGVLWTAGVVREMRSDRRPVWLATWLAACYAHGRYCVAGTWMVTEHASPLLRAVAVSVPPVAMALLTCWHHPRWRRAAIVVSLLLITSWVLRLSVHTPPFHPVPETVAAAVQMAVWIFIALRVFAASGVAHPVHVSLFLYAVTLGLQGIGGAPGLAQFFQPALLLSAVGVAAYCRTPSWSMKVGLLAAAVCAWAACIFLPYPAHALGWVPLMALTLAVIVGTPILLRWRQRTASPKQTA